jgi:hypothetical protein
MIWARIMLAMAGVLICVASSATEIHMPLAFDQAAAPDAPPAFSPSAAFVPPPDTEPAREPFEGVLALEEAPMPTVPTAFKTASVLGKNPQVFPAVRLSFITVGPDLVPATQDVIRAGSLGNGASYWDMLVQPGKVWSEPSDDGWSRGSFPFALVHSLEGETHNGVAMFLYRGGEVKDVRYQIVQQTAPFYVEEAFTAVGGLKAGYERGAVADADAIRSRFQAAMAAAEPIGTWSELAGRVGSPALMGFNSDIRPDEIVLDGVLFGDRFYLRHCPTPAGDLPYCDRQRFGVWSVTKAAANATALLRLAAKFGPSVFDERIVDHVPEARGLPGWERVRFGDALNMATGMGYGPQDPDPSHFGEPFDPPYTAWYEARDAAGKLKTLLEGAKPYPWEPGKVARYRDEDMFLLGVAMTRFLQAREGPDANVWTMLEREVFAPIGIHYAPINKTIEAEPGRDQPLMAFAWYPTVGDLVKVARLYQNGGRFGEQQILDPSRLQEISAGREGAGLPTGNPDLPRYGNAFWRGQMTARAGCSFSYPVMVGWGENLVALMPKKIAIIRLARNQDGDPGAGRMATLEGLADRLTNLCD